ncbi:MAG: class I SAM-dependent methyltransferase, partial [Rubrobacter sp.]|nr:class I SAM-dependent methyltransferase [Rubrobacter sp.]
RLRREVLRDVRGRVLELGLGTGRNIPLYPEGVDFLTGIDPDETMLEEAQERARKAGFPVRLLPVPAEELPFEDASFDAVTGTLVFCTIPDVARALGEVRRVLGPGGELRLLEHVRMDREPFATVQETVTPVWKHLAGGCHLDRDTLSAVREAGFEVEHVQRRLDGLLLGIFAHKPR